MASSGGPQDQTEEMKKWVAGLMSFEAKVDKFLSEVQTLSEQYGVKIMADPFSFTPYVMVVIGEKTYATLFASRAGDVCKREGMIDVYDNK